MMGWGVRPSGEVHVGRKRSIVACFTVVLVGCTVGPDYRAPQARVPERWSEWPASQPATQTAPAGPETRPAPTTATATDLARWWRILSDPTLDALVERMVLANVDLRIAEARIREARAQRDIVAGGRYPRVGTGASYSRQYPSENGLEGEIIDKATGVLPIRIGDLDYEMYQAGFDASWELDLFGGVRRGVEAAAANAAAAVEQRSDLLISLVAEVARNYVELRGAQRRLAIARGNLAAQRATLDLVRQKRSAGTVTELDVTRAAAQVALSEAYVPVFERQVRLSVHALGQLLAEDLDSLGGELAAAPPVHLTPGEVPDMGIPGDLLRRRPDIRQAERTVAAATAQIGVATADLFPRVSLTGRFGLEATRFADLGDWDSRTFGFGPAIRWPLFEGGRIRANIRLQDARQEQALAAYERVVLAAIREVEDALVTYTTVQARRRSLGEAAERSRQAVDLAQLSYDAGATDLLTVLDAQRTLYAAQDALAEADQTVVLSLVALYKSLGGGWGPANETGR